jgi:hypothetical protein
MSTQEREGRIRTNNLSFHEELSQPIELPLEDKTPTIKIALGVGNNMPPTK